MCDVTLAAGVQQSGLEAHVLQLRQRLVDAELHREPSVRRHVGQRQQVRGAHEEVAVERVDGYPSGGNVGIKQRL